ncbi:MAG: class I mannose-6-phosphate isomerase, partial [Rikenellaceae bacterium]|nr:class I mannose-6-phosphate isomerase [Rikenellaceae bacterium]
LSIQVHPDDPMAAQRHGAYGKTEMWVVMEAEPGAYFYLGFNREVSEQEFLTHLENHTLPQIMNRFTPQPGDAFFIPAGTIHSIGKGLVIAEIQQTSDVTYRIYDWDRKNAGGNTRELHTELAMEALDLGRNTELVVSYQAERNRSMPLKTCSQFTVRIIELDGKLERDYLNLDSFVIYMNLEGEIIVECDGGAESMLGTETVLIPAQFESVRLSGKGKLLEIYMPQ